MSDVETNDSWDVNVIAVPYPEGPSVFFHALWWNGPELSQDNRFRAFDNSALEKVPVKIEGQIDWIKVEPGSLKRRFLALLTRDEFGEIHERYLPEYQSLPYHAGAHSWVQNYAILEDVYEKQAARYPWFIVQIHEWGDPA